MKPTRSQKKNISRRAITLPDRSHAASHEGKRLIVRPMVELLEERLLLSTDLSAAQKVLVLNGMAAMEDVSPYLNTAGALGNSVSILGSGMGSSFGVNSLVSQDIITASENYFNANTSWSLEGWATYLHDNAAQSSISNITYSTGEAGVVSFSFNIAGQKNIHAWNLDMGALASASGLDELGLDISGSLAVTVSAAFSGAFTLGIDSNANQFFVSSGGMSLDMGFSGNTPLAVTMGLFSLQTGAVSGSGVQIDASLVDPNSSGRIYTSELVADTATIVSASAVASGASLSTPLSFTNNGVTIDAFTVPPTLTISSANIVISSTVTLGTTNFDNLLRTTSMSADSLADGFIQLAHNFGGMQGLAVMQSYVPFTGSKVGDILKMTQVISDGLNSNIMAAVTDVNAQDFGQLKPTFDTMAEFAGDLDGLAGLIHINPNTQEMTLVFSYQYDFSTQTTAMDLSAVTGDLSLSTTSTLSLDGSVDVQFTLGVQIAPGEQLVILPAGQGAATETPGAGILNGRLGSNAHFGIYLDGVNYYAVTVPAASTSTNGNLLDLVTDINAALATAGLGSEVEAYFVNYGGNVAGSLNREVTLADFSNGTYNHTGLIGLRTINDDHYAMRVTVAPGDIANTQLGYPASLSVTPDALAFYIDNASVTAAITLSGDPVTATGRMGIVSLSLAGSASVTGTLTGSLVNPNDHTGKILFTDFAALVAAKRWPDILHLVYTGDGSVVFDSVTVAGLGGLSFGASPQIEISFANITAPRVLTVTMTDLGNLTDLQDLSAAQVLALLSQGATLLSQMQGMGALQYRLPILNLSAADILDVASQWAATIAQAKANAQAGESLQMMSVDLNSILAAKGLPGFTLSLDGASLKVTLDYVFSVSKTMPFELDLGSLLSLAGGSTGLFDKLTDLFDASGSALVSVAAQADASVSLGLDLSDVDDPRMFVYDDSHLVLELAVSATDLNFTFSFGPLSVAVINGSAVLDADGDAGTAGPASLAVTIQDNDADGRHYFDAVAPLTNDLTVVVTAGIGVSLPVYFPTASMPLGGEGNNIIALTAASLENVINAVPGSVVITAPNFNNLLSGVNIISVLADPAAVLNGLQSQFNMVFGSLSAVISAADLPLVGDQLVNSVDFVQDMGNNLLSKVRTTLNLALDGQSPTDLLRGALFAAFGAYLTDTNHDGQINIDDVVMDIDTVDYQNIEYRVELAGTIFSTAIDFGGIDILPLNVSGQLGVSMGWTWNFGFGLNVTDGFYVVSSYEPELALTVGVTVPQDLHGQLFILDADVTSMNDAGTAPQRDRQVISGQFFINLVDPSHDGRLTLAEMRSTSISQMVEAGFTGALHADLQLVLSLGGSSIFPQFRVVASLDWELDMTFGQPISTTPLTVEFNSVAINLGSVINGFLKPVLTQIDDILSPLQPVLDFLSDDLPIVNASILDIASAFGYGNYADFITAVDWVVDLAHDVASMPGTDYWLELGSFSVTGDSGTSEGGTITNGATPDFDTALAGSDADAGTKSFLSTATSGNAFFQINILKPSTIFQFLMGQDVSLLTFAIPDLSISAEYSQFFSVFGPLGMRITGDIGATLHIGFGYDTYGIREARETGNWAYLLDGFYVTNRENADGTGAVVPTVVFSLGFSAAAELNLGIARGGVAGGIDGEMDLTLVDPNDDGKIRLTELWAELQDPRKMFDIHIIVTAEVTWYIKIGFGALSVSFDGTIWSGTIYEDSFLAPRDPVLARASTGDQLVLNVGEFAADRLGGDTSDGNDTVGVSASGNSLTVVINGVSQTLDYTPGQTLLIDTGNGDDTVTIDSSVQANVEFNGGAGNDTIHMYSDGDLTADGGDGNDSIYYYGSGNAVLVGGAGDDRLEGGSGTNIINGGEGNDTLVGGLGANTFVFVDGFGTDTLSSSGDTNVIDYSAVTAPLTLDLTNEEVHDQAGNASMLNFLPTLAIGGTGVDRILGQDETSTWNITGADEGNYNGVVGFESFEQLVGLESPDRFVFQDGAYISGLIDGGSGAEDAPGATYAQQVGGDTIDLSDYSTSNRIQVTGINDGRLYLAGANPEFSSVETFLGGSGRDYLVLTDGQYIVGEFDGGGNQDRIDASDYKLTDTFKSNLWELTGVNQGSLNRLTAFSDIENYTGGQIEDMFYLYPAGTYDAGFLHAPSGTGGAIDGSVEGDAANDTISASPPVVVTEIPAIGATFGAGNDDVPTMGMSDELPTGDIGDSRIDASDYDVVWSITGHNSGTRTDINGTTTFSDLQNIEGSPANELFIMYPGGSMDGYIDGEGGNDAMVYGWGADMFDSAVSVGFHSANEASATSVGGYVRNIELFIAGTSNANQFTGPDQATSWTITGENTGHMGGGATPMVSFVDFQNIAGGIGADNFAFSSGGYVTGGVIGGGGADKVDMSGLDVPVSIVVTDQDTGVISVSGQFILFSQIESATTGSGDDIFDFQGNTAQLSGTIDGGSGTDSIVYLDVTADRTIQITSSNAGTIQRTGGTTAFINIEGIGTGSGNDRFVFVQGASLSGFVDGGGGTDTFDYTNWNALSAVSVNLQTQRASGVGMFAHVEQFLGGASSQNQVTGLDADADWVVDGIDDSLVDYTGAEYRFYNFQHLIGGSGDDAFLFDDLKYVHGPISGSGGDDTLSFAGYSLEQTWSITGDDAGNVLMTQTLDPLRLDFDGVENIQAGDANNSFTFSDAAELTSLYGGAGEDVLDLSAYTTSITINMLTFTMTPIDSFGGIEKIISGQANDTLIGDDVDINWYVYGENDVYYDAVLQDESLPIEVTSYVLDVQGVENLIGGSGRDAFIFADGTSIDGSLDGSGNTNAIILYEYTTSVQVDLENQTATGIGEGWANVDVFIGGQADNTLIGQDGQDNTWNIENPDSGQINAGETIFYNFGNLIGGDGDDAFVFADAAFVTGTIDGQAGYNTLDYEDYTTAVSVDLALQAATGMDGFANIDQLIGGQASDGITGPYGDTTFTITGADIGTIVSGDDTFDFAGFENLTGNGSTDTFVLPDGGSLSGILDGGLGWDTLDYSDRATAISVNLQTGSATDTGSLAGIEHLVGSSSAQDQLTGPDTASTWHITQNYGGNINRSDLFLFQGIESLVGGSGSDTFVVASIVASVGNLDGGDGDNTLDLSARGAGVAVNITGANAGTVTDLADFTDIGNLTLTQGNDTVALADQAYIDGQLDGRGGTNTLDYSAYLTSVFVDVQAGLATGMDSFLNIGQFIGGAGTDNAVTGPDANSNWLITQADGFTLNGVMVFTNFQSIQAGSGDDTLAFNPDGSLSGSVDGGDGDNELDISSIGFGVTVNLADGTIEDVVGHFSNISAFTADVDFDNTLIGTNADSTWLLTSTDGGTVNDVSFTNFGTLVGGSGVDQFIFSDAVVVTGSVDGGAGIDRIDLTAYTTINTWTSLEDGSVQIKTNFGTFSYQNIENYDGNMSVYLFTHSDLSIAWGSYSLPSIIVPGQSFVLPVVVTNLSNVSLKTGIQVNIYASTDTTLDVSDLAIGSLTKVIQLAQDQSTLYQVTSAVPLGYTFGSYYLIAVVDPLNAIQEVNENNNTAVSAGTQAVGKVFGQIPGSPTSVSLYLPNDIFTQAGPATNVPQYGVPISNGYEVFTITGPGWGRINDDGSTEVFDTTTASTVSVSVTPSSIDGPNIGALLSDVTVHSSLKAFVAPAIMLVGSMNFAGSIQTLTLNSVGDWLPRAIPGDIEQLSLLGDPDIREQLTISIGSSTVATTIVLGAVTDLSLTTGSPVALLQATNWLDTNDTADTVSAGTMGQVHILGEMDAAIQAGALGTYSVGGALVGDAAVDGNLNTLIADGAVSGQLHVGGNVAMADLDAGMVVRGSLTVDGNLKNADIDGALVGLLHVGGLLTSLTVTGDMSGRLEVGGNLTKATLGGLSGQMAVQGAVNSMVVNGDLSGGAFAFRSWKTISINGGNLSGTVGTNQSIGALRIRSVDGLGGSLAGSVEAGDQIGSLRAGAGSTGLIQAPQIVNLAFGNGFSGTINATSALGQPTLTHGRYGIGSLSVAKGDLDGTINADSITSLRVSKGDMKADMTVNGDATGKAALVNLRIVGNATGATWDVAGDIGTINILGQASGLNVYADGNVKQFTARSASALTLTAGIAGGALSDDVISESEITNANAVLSSVTIGASRHAAVSSDVILAAAKQMGTIKLSEVNDLGLDGGSALWLSSADAISRLSSRSTAQGGLNWTYTPNKADPWAVDADPLEMIV